MLKYALTIKQFPLYVPRTPKYQRSPQFTEENIAKSGYQCFSQSFIHICSPVGFTCFLCGVANA